MPQCVDISINAEDRSYLRATSRRVVLKDPAVYVVKTDLVTTRAGIARNSHRLEEITQAVVGDLGSFFAQHVRHARSTARASAQRQIQRSARLRVSAGEENRRE